MSEKTLGSLQKIREQFRQRNSDAEGKPKCPNCNHELTVDKTEFFETELCENCFEHSKIRDLSACCRSPVFALVKLITAGGAIQVREQCSNCGFAKPSAIGGLSQTQKDSLPMFNEGLRSAKQELKYASKRQFGIMAANKKYSNSRDNWLKKYTDYLNSPEWRNKRDLVLRRDNYMCQACLAAMATQVHHKSYEFVDLRGNEPSFDLVSVCSPCHEKIEAMKKESRKPQ